MEDPTLPADAPPATVVDPFAVLEEVPAVIAVIDPVGQVTYVNGQLDALTGYTPEELLGTNMLDHIDLGWNPLSLESIGYALDHPGVRLPTMMRFKLRSGDHRVLEVVANNQLDNTAIAGLVVHLRDVEERDLTDQILEAFASGADVATTLRKVHAVGASTTMAADTAIVILPPRGELPARLSATDGVDQLVASTHPDAPWVRAVGTEAPWTSTEVEDLPTPLRQQAEALGYRACWAWPVARRGHHEVAAVLVFWRREPGPPEPSAQTLGERLVSLAVLVLERTEHLRELEHAATHDPLTGLANRARFFDELDRHLAEAVVPVGLLALDLDGFKAVNDGHGHGAGDRVLVAVADRLRGAVRPGDLVGRLGGDEFAVCCPGAEPEVMTLIAERLLAAVPEPVSVVGRRLSVGTTIGVAWTRPGGSTGDLLADAADRALLRAKATAKGTWRSADHPEHA